MLPNSARNQYYALLEDALNPESFLTEIAFLLDRNPYFMPGYLEMLWSAEEHNDPVVYQSLLRKVLRYAQVVCLESAHRKRAVNEWSTLELDAFRDLLHIAKKSPLLTSRERLIARLLSKVAANIVEVKVIESQYSPRNLQLVRTLDVESCNKELKYAAPYWWQISTSRQEVITHHRHTRCILLRKRPDISTTYSPNDGVHESIPTPLAARFPATHTHVLRCASELGIGLGRVAIVELAPFAQVYRHYDAEPHYEGRDRYHLVLSAGNRNILSSGSEVVNVRPGDLWYFNNHIMHRAHNLSSIPRTHVIFDGHPLQRPGFGMH